jgi:hypothetical protein
MFELKNSSKELNSALIEAETKKIKHNPNQRI